MLQHGFRYAAWSQDTECCAVRISLQEVNDCGFHADGTLPTIENEQILSAKFLRYMLRA
jgi:hypothetical protein